MEVDGERKAAVRQHSQGETPPSGSSCGESRAKGKEGEPSRGEGWSLDLEERGQTEKLKSFPKKEMQLKKLFELLKGLWIGSD